MATTAQRLIVNVETGTLLPNFDGVVGTTQPRYTLGDTTPVEIYLVKSQGSVGTLSQVGFPPVSTVTLAVGVVNEQPTGGKWSLTYDGDTATDLAHNITATALQTAVNALASVTTDGGVTVDKVGSQFRITWNTTGAKDDFSGGGDTLVPASGIGVQKLQDGNATTKEVILVNLAVSPIALTTTFTDSLAPSGAYSATGFSLSGGVRGGGYKLQLTFTQGTTTKTIWTDTINVGLSLQEISKLIFDALVNAGWGAISGNETTNAWGLRVSALDAYQWRVDFTQPVFTTPVAVTGPTIAGIDVTGVTALAGKVGELSVATAEAVAFLGTDASKRGVLEVQVESGTVTQTLIQTPCEIVGQVIADGAFAPLPVGVPLSETVANSRFLRRDADQTLDPTTKNQLWENLLGVTTPTGVNLVAALVGAVLPSSSNVLVTMSQRNPFDQDLNTSDLVEFSQVAVTGSLNMMAAAVLNVGTGGVRFDDITYQYTALPSGGSDGDVPVWDASLSKYVAGPPPNIFDQPLNTTDGVTFADVTLGAGGVVTFADATTQESAPTFSSATGQSGGSGSIIHHGDYPDEIRIVIGGVTYAMPARIV